MFLTELKTHQRTEFSTDILKWLENYQGTSNSVFSLWEISK